MATATSAPTVNDRNDKESQLSVQTITNTLRYLVPPCDDGIPPGLLSKQLKRRHHFLDIQPNDQTSYFCLNPDHPTQDPKSVLAALYQLSGRNAESLVGQTAYSTDGESILAHVIIGSQVEACFVWEILDADPQNGKIGEWKYLDVKPLPLPRDAFETVLEAQAARIKPTPNPRVVINDSSPAAAWEDAYWSQYDNVAPSVSNGLAATKSKAAFHLARTGSGGGLSLRSNSPRREDAYWDRYGYSEDEEEEGMISLAAPAPAVQPNLRISNPVAETRHLIQPTSRRPSEFDPEDLSKALSSHLQDDISLSTEHSQRNSPPFSEPNLSADADGTSPMFESSMLGLSDVAANGDDITPAPEVTMAEASDVKQEDIAVRDAVKGLFQLWKKTRQIQDTVHPDSQEEKNIFMSIVSKSIADI